ncbi:MAG TPA: hypothetical protein VGM19_15010 [Armatimonadota bacterium]|jgi:hypothetical protein
MSKAPCVLILALLVAALLTAGAVSAQENWMGPNLVANPGFEQVDAAGLPTDWRPTANPAGSAKFSQDKQIYLVDAAAMKIEVPDTGGATLQSKPVPVVGGKSYLFSLAFKADGFGEPGKYSGVDGYVGTDFLDATGKNLGRGPGVGFPYNHTDWDLRDVFIPVPPTATQMIISASVSNHSAKQIGTNIPSTLWLDAVQLREYTPPVTPEWAKQKVPRIVEGGITTSRAQAYQLAGLNNSGGKWSPISADPNSDYGSILTSPPGVGPGIMAHSPYFTSMPPGLYRAVLRARIGDPSKQEKVGAIDIGSEFAGMRAGLDIYARDFAKADTYQDFSMDFILRSAGYWMFRVYTEGNQPFTVDTVKIFQLSQFQDRQLLDLYPGSEGAIPADVQPRRNTYPFTGLLVAGALYDYYRIVDAFHLTGTEMKLDTVPIEKGRSQVYVGFPGTAKELFDHNLIYLCGADASALTLRQKHMIAEYVRRGGGLIVLGGHKTLDRGSMGGSLLDEILPLDLPAEPRQLIFTPEGTPVLAGTPHPLTQYVDFSAKPVSYYMHDLQAKPAAQVLLTAGGKPGLVIWQAGKGRVATVDIIPMGSPAEGQVPFWKWDGWVNLLRDLSWWVAGQDDHFPS